MHVLPKNSTFIPYSHIFLDDWKPIYTQTEDRLLRICHAPSHRAVKGTKYILSAVENLKSCGYNFDLILIENMSNSDARKQYEKCDVLIDQLFAGWYGGLAVELMALGKPVMVYIREEDLQFIPKEMAQSLPFITASADTIEEKLEIVLNMDRNKLLKCAYKSREYVEIWHDPIKIANIIKKDYEMALMSK